MIYTPKQLDLMRRWQHNKLSRINLLEGSVSSGKTWISLVLWAFWVKTMPQDKLYLMCAKSLTTLKRNCLLLLQELIGERNFTFSVPSKEGFLFGRRVLLEGANDARAESKIRGMTLQGAYCDELTQFPQDFFAMLLSRLRLPGAKLIATTNPDAPGHWLKTDYIDRADELDFLDVKFIIDDNTTLPEDYVEAIKKEYVGVFYERFILGKWVLAEGLIYPMY
jgi:PBSX family phage terminase large subunit